MVTDLNKLAELIELDSLPAWLRKELESKRPEIVQKLDTDGYFVFTGPNGEEIRITRKARSAAALAGV